MNSTCAIQALTPPPEEVIDLLPNSTFINGTGYHNSTNGTVPDYFISAINSTNATSEKPDNSTMLIVTPAVMESGGSNTVLIAVIVVLVCLFVLGLVPFYILRRIRAKEKLRTEQIINEPPMSAVVPE